MSSAVTFPPSRAYEGRIEKMMDTRTRRTYYRYVISSEVEQLFDGWAGDVKEASDTIKAHLQLLNAPSSSRVM
ncbi:MAG: hypothetical protein ACR2IF_13435 [Terriglobales bacterium]